MKKDYKKELDKSKKELKNISSDKLNSNFDNYFKDKIENTKDQLNQLKSMFDNDIDLKKFFDGIVAEGLSKRDIRNNYNDINFENTNIHEISMNRNTLGYLLKSYNIENEKYIIYAMSLLWENLVNIYKDKAGEVFLKDVISLLESNINLYEMLVPTQLNKYKKELESTQAKIIKLELELSDLRILEFQLSEKIKELEN